MKFLYFGKKYIGNLNEIFGILNGTLDFDQNFVILDEI